MLMSVTYPRGADVSAAGAAAVAEAVFGGSTVRSEKFIGVRLFGAGTPRTADVSVAGLRPVEIVGVAREVFLLPVAERHFEDAHGPIARADKAVFFAGGNPHLRADGRVQRFLADLNFRAGIEHDPQLGASGVRLQAETFAGLHGH